MVCALLFFVRVRAQQLSSAVEAGGTRWWPATSLVVGAPIPVQAMDPTVVMPAELEAAVDELHAKYCAGEAHVYV
jgi:hypothetical protein